MCVQSNDTWDASRKTQLGLWQARWPYHGQQQFGGLNALPDPKHDPFNISKRHGKSK